MSTFKEGTLREILDDNAFEKGFRNLPNYNKPNSFAVRVTYYDIEGAHTEDAVLKFTGNAPSVYSGLGTFSLTRADGSQISTLLLQNPNSLNDNLDDYIQVYDTKDEFGKTTVDNLNEQVEKARTPEETTTDQPQPPSAQQSVTVDETSFGIKKILNRTYPHVAEILYVDYLKDSEATTFSTYTESITTSCNNAIELSGTIEEALKASGSSAFYTGASASPHVTNLQETASNSKSMINAVSEVTSDEVSVVITAYNNTLKEAKKLVRQELLNNAAELFNYNNSFNAVETTTTTQSCAGYVGGGDANITYDSAGVWKYVTTESEAILDTSNQTWSNNTITKKFKYIKVEDNATAMESRFEFHNEQLPYNKNQIIE